MTEQILPAFNGRLNLRVAYGFNRNQVFQFLAAVAANPVHYGIQASEQQTLVAIRDEIINLSLPNGTEYQKNGHDPDQHIFRVLNGNWVNQNQTPNISKFHVCSYKHDGFLWWSPVDLLGLFLSKSRPPATANKRNFFLPITAMFGRWCAQLIQAPPPFMLQCTWVNDNGVFEFFLGANLTGYKFGPAVGDWQLACQKARYNILDTEVLNLHGWSFTKAPMIDVGEENVWKRNRARRFGNCAETYPWTKILRRGGINKTRVYGLALSKAFHQAQAYDDRLSGPIWKSLEDPCQNCVELLRIYGGRLENFRKMYGAAGAPA